LWRTLRQRPSLLGGIRQIRTIDLEEHFATPAYLDGPAHRLKEQAAVEGGRFAALISQLVDAGDGRIARWTPRAPTCRRFRSPLPASNSSMPRRRRPSPEAQTPLSRTPSVAIRHDSSAWRRCPSPTAVAELERAVGEAGFKSVVINGHHRGRYLDDRSSAGPGAGGAAHASDLSPSDATASTDNRRRVRRALSRRSAR